MKQTKQELARKLFELLRLQPKDDVAQLKRVYEQAVEGGFPDIADHASFMIGMFQAEDEGI